MADGSSGSEDDGDEQRAELIVQLRRSLKANPYHYDSHILFIKTLKEAAELEQLRHARTKMAEVYPLTEDLWLDWLADEIELADSTRARQKVADLFAVAVEDYLSPALWTLYCQFMAGAHSADPDVFDLPTIRAVFDKAITASGQHYTGGGNLWAVIHEFELRLFDSGPQAGSELQQARVHSILKRWAAAPIDDENDGGVWTAIEEWAAKVSGGTVSKEFVEAKAASSSMREKYADLEAEIKAAAPPRLDAYVKLITFEIEAESSPDRVILAYERTLAENALAVEIWHGYGEFSDRAIVKVPGLIDAALRVHHRAIRNCPWVAAFWVNLAHMTERSGQPAKSVYEQALIAGLTAAPDFLEVWANYAEHVHRLISTEPEAKQERGVNEWRVVLDRAAAHLNQFFGRNGDPNARLGLYRARLEATKHRDIEAARAVHDALVKEGHASQAHVWLAQARLEQSLGTEDTCRRILTEAVQKVSDDPESVCQALLTFERDVGSLDEYDEAARKVAARLRIVSDRRAQAAQKHQASSTTVKRGAEKKKTADKKGGDAKAGSRKEKRKRGADEDGAIRTLEVSAPKKPLTNPRGEKRKRASDEDGGAVEDADAQAAIGPTAPKKRATDSKKVNKAAEGDGDGAPVIDPSTYPRTVFLKNLSFSVAEPQIEEVFSVCGNIEEVRLVRTSMGKSKGFAYVQFEAEASVESALAMDRHSSAKLDFRPVYVNKCEVRNADEPAVPTGPKYASTLERNKLYVSGLSYSLTEQEIRDFFEPFGELVGVRLATSRSGQSKGYAFVEYKDEKVAAAALIGGNNQVLKGREIKVALSDPPKKEDRPSASAVSGVGPTSSSSGEFRPVPRALHRERKRPGLGFTKISAAEAAKPATTPATTSQPAASAPSDDTEASAAKKNNAFFASLFKKA